MDSENNDEINVNEVSFDEEAHELSGEKESIGIASPTYSAPGSPDGDLDESCSPIASNPQSPDNNSLSNPGSPLSPPSPANLASPDSHSNHSGPASPDCVEDAPESPDQPGQADSPTSMDNPESPVGPASPLESPLGSPLSAAGSHRSRSVSSDENAIIRSRSNSPAGSGNPSRSGSPAGAHSRSGSPAGSHNRSWSASPAGSKGQSVSPAGSRNASPGGNQSTLQARSRSGSPRNGSPHQSLAARSRSGSLRGSRSRSVSPTGSRSRSRTTSPLARSRSASLASNKNHRSRSRSASPVRNGSASPAGIRSLSRSVSPALSRSRSPNKSRSSRSRSASPALSQSRRRSRSPAKSHSRSVSPARSRSPPGSPEGDDEEVVGRRKRQVTEDSDHEASDKGSEVGELIADIFGSSDEEEFEGFGNTEAEIQPKKDKKKAAVLSDDDGAGDGASVLPDLSDDDDLKGKSHAGDFVSDFDLMLERKKEEMRKRRKKRKDIDIINDNDDLIDALIAKMRTAAEDDRTLNQQRKPAVKKLGMLPKVVSQLKKADLQNAFIDGGILSAMTEWLAPLPDKSLPHLQIREAMLKHLLDFPTISNEGLKTSGIGKAVMYLYKHPKEIRQNKEMAQKLINEWSRPIFNLTSDLKNLSREEREQRDYEHLPKKRRISLETGATPRRDIDNALASDDRALRPGDPGYVYRARVPQPSVKDYVIRPKWNVEEKIKGSGKKQVTKYELHMRAQKRKMSAMKQQRAVTMSIEGRNMSI